MRSLLTHSCPLAPLLPAAAPCCRKALTRVACGAISSLGANPSPEQHGLSMALTEKPSPLVYAESGHDPTSLKQPPKSELLHICRPVRIWHYSGMTRRIPAALFDPAFGLVMPAHITGASDVQACGSHGV